jgi:hypothetical protein
MSPALFFTQRLVADVVGAQGRFDDRARARSPRLLVVDQAAERLVGMLSELVTQAKRDSIHLAPVIGLACPGVIGADGSIASGAHNLGPSMTAPMFHGPPALCYCRPEFEIIPS